MNSEDVNNTRHFKDTLNMNTCHFCSEVMHLVLVTCKALSPTAMLFEGIKYGKYD